MSGADVRSLGLINAVIMTYVYFSQMIDLRFIWLYNNGIASIK